MRKITFYLLILCTFSLTGCIETLEEMWLNKDGSGKYSLTFDMSELFSDPMMKGLMQDAAKEGGLEGTGIDLNEMDTMAVLGQGDGSILDNVVMRMVMSDSSGKFFVKMTMPFEEVSEITEFYEAMSEGGGDQAAMNPMAGLGSTLFAPAGTFELNKRTLVRKASPNTGENELMEGEDGQMMKMFFANSTFKSIYQLPGKVKKSNVEGATVEGNTVTIEKPLLDLMEGKTSMEGSISFKRN